MHLRTSCLVFPNQVRKALAPKLIVAFLGRFAITRPNAMPPQRNPSHDRACANKNGLASKRGGTKGVCSCIDLSV